MIRLLISYLKNKQNIILIKFLLKYLQIGKLQIIVEIFIAAQPNYVLYFIKSCRLNNF